MTDIWQKTLAAREIGTTDKEKNWTVQPVQTGAGNPNRCSFSGTGQRSNVRHLLELTRRWGCDGLANLKFLFSRIWSFPLSHRKRHYFQMGKSLPCSSFTRQEGTDQHSQCAMKQRPQHVPASPWPSRRKVKEPELTISAACTFAKERSSHPNSRSPPTPHLAAQW